MRRTSMCRHCINYTATHRGMQTLLVRSQEWRCHEIRGVTQHNALCPIGFFFFFSFNTTQRVSSLSIGHSDGKNYRTFKAGYLLSRENELENESSSFKMKNSLRRGFPLVTF